MRSRATQTAVCGPMYVWDIARVNGTSWDPTNRGIVDFVKSLCADCPSRPAEDAGLRAAGHLQYEYAKKLENKLDMSREEKVGLKKHGKVQDAAEYQQISDAMAKEDMWANERRGQDTRGRKRNAQTLAVANDAMADLVLAWGRLRFRAVWRVDPVPRIPRGAGTNGRTRQR